MKKVQDLVGKAGDQILEDLRCKSQAVIQGTRFLGNEEFLQSISPDKIGYLQEQEDRDMVYRARAQIESDLAELAQSIPQQQAELGR